MTTVMQDVMLELPATSRPVTQKTCEPPLENAGIAARTASVGESKAPSCASIPFGEPPSSVNVAPAMFEPPVATSLTSAVRSNGTPTTTLLGDVDTACTVGGCTSSTVASNVANVSLAPVTLSTARASTRCGPDWPIVQRSCAMPSAAVI